MNPSSLSLNVCNICPRNCLVNRKNKLGFCQKGNEIEISWFGSHFGEEGSGTVFFSGCNLSCVYCQNWQISQKNIRSVKYSIDKVVDIFFTLQNKGCHNINLVSPTIWSLQLIKVIKKAKIKGLKIPVIWNSNAYENVLILEQLEDLVDIYLPDYKYSGNTLGVKYSSVPDYSKVAKKAILEMRRQVGDLVTSRDGIAQKGLIIRHLLLPENLENTQDCLNYIREVSPNIHLSLMSQYNPAYKAIKINKLNRIITSKEYQKVQKMVEYLDFKYGWFQEHGSQDCFNPDFNQEQPFKAKT
jgi:putative pyruvate formate lyase activating enzyme